MLSRLEESNHVQIMKDESIHPAKTFYLYLLIKLIMYILKVFWITLDFCRLCLYSLERVGRECFKSHEDSQKEQVATALKIWNPTHNNTELLGLCIFFSNNIFTPLRGNTVYHFIQQMGINQFEGIRQAASQGLLVLTCIAFVLRYCS